MTISASHWRKGVLACITAALTACSYQSAPTSPLTNAPAIQPQSSKIDPSGVIFDRHDNVYLMSRTFRVMTDDATLDETLLNIDFVNPTQNITLWGNHYRINPDFPQSSDTGDGSALLYYSFVDPYGKLVPEITRYIIRYPGGQVCYGSVSAALGNLPYTEEYDCVVPSSQPSPSPSVAVSPTANPSPTPSVIVIPPSREPSPTPSPSAIASAMPSPMPSPLPSIGSLPTGRGLSIVVEILEARMRRGGLTPRQEDRIREAIERITGMMRSPAPTSLPTATPTAAPTSLPSPTPTRTPFPSNVVPGTKAEPDESDPEFKLIWMYNKLVADASYRVTQFTKGTPVNPNYTVTPPKIGRKQPVNYISIRESEILGAWWVGLPYRERGGFWYSQDGYRRFRPVSAKESGRTQANYEVFKFPYGHPGFDSFAHISNGHVFVQEY